MNETPEKDLSITEMLLMMMSIVPSLACVGIAGLLVLRNLDGWGWFLFVAICLFPRIRTGKAALEKNDD
ncbi:nitrate reductase NapE component [Ochrobactrum sp. P20RRXII]|nr:hypothetical protein [Ochrobactrum sp. P20RRXII]NIH77371.1 nitrate reductase NapE component [Ochrobactrum sp. P20RRXII]